MSTIEIASFRTATGVTPAQMKQAWQASQTFATVQPGYVTRRLMTDGNGNWIDLVEWVDMDAAHAAKAAFDPETYPDLLGLIGAVDMASLTMQYMQTVA